jgi:hypothetical protein
MALPAVTAALLAVVLPAAASAATLKNESGLLVAVGTQLKVHPDQLEFDSVTGWSDCEAGAKPLTIEATENNGSVVEAEEEYGSASSSCHLSGTLHAATEAMNIRISSLKAEGTEGTGTMSISFEAHPPGRIGNCFWANPTLPISFAGGTNTFTATSRWPESYEEWESNCGELEFKGEFSLTDSKGGKVLLGRESLPPPAVFVSAGTTVHMFIGSTYFVTNYTGSQECYGGSGAVSLTGEASQLEFGYSPAECEIPVRTNGCGLKFHAGTYEVSEHSKGTVDIVCPVGKQIELEMSPSSIVLIPAQSTTHGITFKNGGEPRYVYNVGAVTELSYHLKGSESYLHNGRLEAEMYLSAVDQNNKAAEFYVEAGA